ncbi:MAG: polyprenyl synthetase family protein [Candidatus Promineifilaceae bacterium]
MPISREVITEQLNRLPEIQHWPDVAQIFLRTKDIPHPDWEVPVLACIAVGGREENAFAGATAVACLQISIMLVDDILDDDPRGEHLRRGTGPTANLALAFQAAATRILTTAPAPETAKIAALNSLGKAGLATAYGQSLDIQNLNGEEQYWHVVEAKSTPFYGAIYEIGAYLGGADAQTASALYEFGKLIGEMIQIEDDLADAFAIPANADWLQGRNNLLILYGLTVDHPYQPQFEEIRNHIQDMQNLQKAQSYLIECGAVSYATYQLVTRFQAARQTLNVLNLPYPEHLNDMLDAYLQMLANRLKLAIPDLALEDFINLISS